MKPPDNLSQKEKEAWRNGFIAAQQYLADALEDPETCEECGSEKIQVWGGYQCPECEL